MAWNAPERRDEYLTADVAARRVGLRRRRFNEIASAGGIPRSRQTDPKTQREVWMYRASDVAKMQRERLPAAAARLQIALAPAAPAVATVPAPAPVPLPWLTIAEASAASGLPESVLLRLIGARRLAAIDCGRRPGGRYRVLRADLDSRKLCS